MLHFFQGHFEPSRAFESAKKKLYSNVCDESSRASVQKLIKTVFEQLRRQNGSNASKKINLLILFKILINTIINTNINGINETMRTK